MTNKPPSRPEFSRRAFLKGASAVAAGSAVGHEIAAATQPESGATVFGTELHTIELTVNGKPKQVKVETRTTLLDALREGADLTGTKKVCDRGACGGCTVMLDGETVNSCMTLAFDAVGSKITTIEGLGTPDNLHPMQKAFVECDALQCGFCTPGMIVSATACVQKRGKPSLDQIKADMSGNICRCGTYTRVFEAIQKVGGQKVEGR